MDEPAKIHVYLDSDFNDYLMHSDGSFEVFDGMKSGCIVPFKEEGLPNPAAVQWDGELLGYFSWTITECGGMTFKPTCS